MIRNAHNTYTQNMQTHAEANTHRDANTHTQAQIHTHTHAHMHMYTHARMHARAYTHRHTHAHTHANAHARTHTNTHAHTHNRTHTYAHTHKQRQTQGTRPFYNQYAMFWLQSCLCVISMIARTFPYNRFSTMAVWFTVLQIIFGCCELFCMYECARVCAVYLYVCVCLCVLLLFY